MLIKSRLEIVVSVLSIMASSDDLLNLAFWYPIWFGFDNN